MDCMSSARNTASRGATRSRAGASTAQPQETPKVWQQALAITLRRRPSTATTSGLPRSSRSLASETEYQVLKRAGFTKSEMYWIQKAERPRWITLAMIAEASGDPYLFLKALFDLTRSSGLTMKRSRPVSRRSGLPLPKAPRSQKTA